MPNVSYVYVKVHYLRRSVFQDFEWVLILCYRSGSTVVEYLVRATSFTDSEIAAAEAGILTDLSNIYPMILDSKIIRLCPVAPCSPFIHLSSFNALPFGCVSSLKATRNWGLSQLLYFWGRKSNWPVDHRQIVWTLEKIGLQNGDVIALLFCQMDCTILRNYRKTTLRC